MTYHLQSHHKKIIADTITPVSVYLKVRDHYPNSILLESSDYHANDNSFSYVCFNPIASVSVKNNLYIENHPDGTEKRIELDETSDVPSLISEFSKQFSTTNEEF